MASPSTSKRIIARLIIVGLLLGVVWFVRHRQQTALQLPNAAPTTTSTTSGTHSTPAQGTSNEAKVPNYALEVLNFVRRNGEAPKGFVGGKEFQNREKKLPPKANDGKRIHYSEWDVHPKVEGQNRGPERLVTGSDHSAWYTKDHYKNFVKID